MTIYLPLVNKPYSNVNKVLGYNRLILAVKIDVLCWLIISA